MQAMLTKYIPSHRGSRNLHHAVGCLPRRVDTSERLVEPLGDFDAVLIIDGSKSTLHLLTQGAREDRLGQFRERLTTLLILVRDKDLHNIDEELKHLLQEFGGERASFISY